MNSIAMPLSNWQSVTWSLSSAQEPPTRNKKRGATPTHKQEACAPQLKRCNSSAHDAPGATAPTSAPTGYHHTLSALGVATPQDAPTTNNKNPAAPVAAKPSTTSTPTTTTTSSAGAKPAISLQWANSMGRSKKTKKVEEKNKQEIAAYQQLLVAHKSAVQHQVEAAKYVSNMITDAAGRLMNYVTEHASTEQPPKPTVEAATPGEATVAASTPAEAAEAAEATSDSRTYTSSSKGSGGAKPNYKLERQPSGSAKGASTAAPAAWGFPFDFFPTGGLAPPPAVEPIFDVGGALAHVEQAAAGDALDKFVHDFSGLTPVDLASTDHDLAAELNAILEGDAANECEAHALTRRHVATSGLQQEEANDEETQETGVVVDVGSLMDVGSLLDVADDDDMMLALLESDDTPHAVIAAC